MVNIVETFSPKESSRHCHRRGAGARKGIQPPFAEAGADIVVAELNSKTGPETVKEIENIGRRALFVETDVRQRLSVKAMVEKTIERFNHLDFIMNNAGVVKRCPAESISEKDWREVIAVNLNGLFYCSQAAAHEMIKQGCGCIINIASMSGYIVNRPQPQASYNASKAAVIHLTRSLAAEWPPYNIRVNAIAPGYMDIAMTRKAFEDPVYGSIWTDGIPMRRPGHPEELAPLAIFLASSASSYVTGSTILVDGGYIVW